MVDINDTTTQAKEERNASGEFKISSPINISSGKFEFNQIQPDTSTIPDNSQSVANIKDSFNVARSSIIDNIRTNITLESLQKENEVDVKYIEDISKLNFMEYLQNLENESIAMKHTAKITQDLTGILETNKTVGTSVQNMNKYIQTYAKQLRSDNSLTEVGKQNILQALNEKSNTFLNQAISNDIAVGHAKIEAGVITNTNLTTGSYNKGNTTFTDAVKNIDKATNALYYTKPQDDVLRAKSEHSTNLILASLNKYSDIQSLNNAADYYINNRGIIYTDETGKNKLIILTEEDLNRIDNERNKLNQIYNRKVVEDDSLIRKTVESSNELNDNTVHVMKNLYLSTDGSKTVELTNAITSNIYNTIFNRYDISNLDYKEQFVDTITKLSNKQDFNLNDMIGLLDKDFVNALKQVCNTPEKLAYMTNSIRNDVIKLQKDIGDYTTSNETKNKIQRVDPSLLNALLNKPDVENLNRYLGFVNDNKGKVDTTYISNTLDYILKNSSLTDKDKAKEINKLAILVRNNGKIININELNTETKNKIVTTMFLSKINDPELFENYIKNMNIINANAENKQVYTGIKKIIGNIYSKNSAMLNKINALYGETLSSSDAITILSNIVMTKEDGAVGDLKNITENTITKELDNILNRKNKYNTQKTEFKISVGGTLGINKIDIIDDGTVFKYPNGYKISKYTVNNLTKKHNISEKVILNDVAELSNLRYKIGEILTQYEKLSPTELRFDNKKGNDNLYILRQVYNKILTEPEEFLNKYFYDDKNFENTSVNIKTLKNMYYTPMKNYLPEIGKEDKNITKIQNQIKNQFTSSNTPVEYNNLINYSTIFNCVNELENKNIVTFKTKDNLSYASLVSIINKIPTNKRGKYTNEFINNVNEINNMIRTYHNNNIRKLGK